MDNEQGLLELVASGDEQAFAKLFGAYHQPLGEYVFRITESMQVTEEIVQDVFVKLWLKRETLPQLHSFSNYLFILLRNHTISHLRKKATERTQYIQWAKTFEQEDAPDETVEQYRNWIDEAVAQLPGRQQEIYFLSRYKRLTQKQIARQLQISPHTVKTHLERALAAIKDHVQTKIPAAVLILFLSR